MERTNMSHGAGASPSPDTNNEKDTRKLSAESSGIRVNITLSRTKPVGRPDLVSKYGVSRYDLAQGTRFPDKIKSLVPNNTPEYVERGEKYVERVMRALFHFKQCALIGPSGTGKTHIVYLIAELSGLPIWEINCGLQTSAYDLFGRYIGLGKENWIDGPIVSWCRNGGILYLDEANMMKQDVATRLNPVLDTRGHLVLTEKDNEIIPRHKLGYVIISMNPYSVEFAGTKPLNAAFRRRMSVWIDFDYLSVGSKISDEEIELVGRKGKVDKIIAGGIVRVGAELRRQYKSGDLPYGPSVGDLINWALLVADGVSPKVAAEETIIALTSDSPDVQDIVRRVVGTIFDKSIGAADVSSQTQIPKQVVAPTSVGGNLQQPMTDEKVEKQVEQPIIPPQKKSFRGVFRIESA
jgi:nitric oxide reductase NorQ protein